MPKTILIAPADSSFGTALVGQAVSTGARVIAAVRPDTTLRSEEDESGPSEDSLLELPWNRRSLLSARNVILQGLNTYGAIDRAIIVHVAEAESHPLHELPPVSIETVVDDKVKSPLFMIKELLQHFLRAQTGSLSFALHEPAGVPRTALAASAAAGFSALVGSLLGIYQNEEFQVCGFTSHSDDSDSYASFILHTLQGKSGQSTGKWFRHSGGALHALSRGRR